MNQFLVLGTDTDTGKTTFALLWLTAFPGWHYWKPLETGASDSEMVRRIVRGAIVHEPWAHFSEAVAPPLAARRAGRMLPTAAELAGCTPDTSPLLVETFGSPFSPLNDSELQIDWIAMMPRPVVLVTSSRIGAIGRTLSTLRAMRQYGVEPAVVVMMGEVDDYAREQIERHGSIATVQVIPPTSWDAEGIHVAAHNQGKVFEAIATIVGRSIEAPFVATTAVAVPADIWKLDRQCVWHPYTSLRDSEPPLRVVAAQNEFLELDDGRRVIDGISSWWTILHGHREPRLMTVLREAACSIDHVLFAGVTHKPAIRVAELLLRTAPWNSGRVFFSDNGSTAVEVALKMAYQFWHQRGEPGRTLFIGFENGYHGDTFGAMAVGRDPLFFGKFEPLLFQAERIPVSAERLDAALHQFKGRVAAVIIEPLIQAAGGMQMHSPAELRDIFEVARRHQVLFIADEVMTGCYRTGTMWAHKAAAIAPDLICTAKTLAGGILPLAATLVSPDIVAAFDTSDRADTFFHGHSFTAHPLACAVAAVNLEWLQREPPTAPARFEAFWKAALLPLCEHKQVRAVRITGTVAAIELDVGGGYLAETARDMRQRCLKEGVFLRPLGNVLYALPPFGTSAESLNRIAGAMRAAVASPSILPVQ